MFRSVEILCYLGGALLLAFFVSQLAQGSISKSRVSDRIDNVVDDLARMKYLRRSQVLGRDRFDHYALNYRYRHALNCCVQEIDRQLEERRRRLRGERSD